jgi:hypothetical protein
MFRLFLSLAVCVPIGAIVGGALAQGHRENVGLLLGTGLGALVAWSIAFPRGRVGDVIAGTPYEPLPEDEEPT